jgi:hypothetical protein
MAEIATFTTAELAECAEREVRMRESAYERFIAAGKMTRTKADKEVRMMRAIASRLRTEANGERLL